MQCPFERRITRENVVCVIEEILPASFQHMWGYICIKLAKIKQWETLTVYFANQNLLTRKILHRDIIFTLGQFNLSFPYSATRLALPAIFRLVWKSVETTSVQPLLSNGDVRFFMMDQSRVAWFFQVWQSYVHLFLGTVPLNLTRGGQRVTCPSVQRSSLVALQLCKYTQCGLIAGLQCTHVCKSKRMLSSVDQTFLGW